MAVPYTEKDFPVTAWAAGYFNGGPVSIKPGLQKNIIIELHPHATQDNPDYEWLSSLNQYGEEEKQGCAACHLAQGSQLPFHLPVDEWLVDAHANSARNPLFLTMYSGTDVIGNQSPLTNYVSIKDYGTEPIQTDSSEGYYGPGYKLDFPDTDGNCAACHTPLAAINNPYHTDPINLEGVFLEGINCDFCHKIWDVKLDTDIGLPFQNMPGVLSYEFRRPFEGEQFFAGPYGDVAPGEDTYSPVQTTSDFCAGCHYGVFWDTVIYDLFGEWLRSPYSDPENGQTCQDCHMPRLNVPQFALTEQGGLARDPATIYSHTMPGASDTTLLQNALEMEVTYLVKKDAVEIQVALLNDKTGHNIPTDSPLRHLILLVSASDQQGEPLQQQAGPRLPDWCGEGDPRAGAYAGLPGMVYAKILAEQWTNISPSGAYWNPTYIVSDNRLAPFQTDTSNYEFQIDAHEPVSVHVQLLYRRAFFDLMNAKGWQAPDILMEEVYLKIEP